MSERYSRLFVLSNDLYATGSPVVIAAGALLKDNQTGNVLAQLKLRSITPKQIKAVKVYITSMDTVGRTLGEAVEHQYLDLSISRDAEFGQKAAITLPDPSTRSFSATVEEVAFADNTIWTSNNASWQPLPRPTQLASEIRDGELVKQYQLTYGKQCQFSPLSHDDLWFCSCGAVNLAEESTCHSCHLEYARLLSVQWGELKAARDTRLAKEKAEAERQAAVKVEREIAARIEAERQQAIAKAKTKKRTIASVLCALVIILICIAAYVFTQIIVPAQEQKKAYDAAQSLFAAGSYEDAINAFTALGTYENSAEMVMESKYQIALGILEQKNYVGAENAFLALGDYRNCAEMVLESRYQAAVAKLHQNDFSNAEKAFLALGTYKDSAELAKQAQNGPLEEKYQSALAYVDQQKFGSAYKLFSDLGDYKDSLERKDSVYTAWWKATSVGMRIEFGSYPQSSSGKDTTPIEWYVIEKTDNTALLLSVQGLDWQPFHASNNEVFWKDSNIQKWLNNEFVTTAFSSDEKSKLLQTNHEGSADLVFLLSEEETDRLPNTIASNLKCTRYARAQGADSNSWWTRTHYYSDYYKWHGARVFSARFGAYAATENAAVRPAIWVTFNS